MANPFDNVATVVTPDAERAQFSRLWRAKGRTEIISARNGVDAVKPSLLDAHRLIDGLGEGAEIPQGYAENLENVGREFNRRASKLGFAEGKLGASIKGAVKSMGATLGFDTGTIGASPIKGDVNEVIIKAYGTKASVFERLVSKPFRVAANNPRTALVGLGLGTVALVGAFFKGRAEKRTEENVQAQAMAAQAQMNLPPQQGPSYKNSVSADEAAALDAQLKQSGAAGHADAVAAARQPVPAPGAAL